MFFARGTGGVIRGICPRTQSFPKACSLHPEEQSQTSPLRWPPELQRFSSLCPPRAAPPRSHRQPQDTVTSSQNRTGRDHPFVPSRLPCSKASSSSPSPSPKLSSSKLFSGSRVEAAPLLPSSSRHCLSIVSFPNFLRISIWVQSTGQFGFRFLLGFYLQSLHSSWRFFFLMIFDDYILSLMLSIFTGCRACGAYPGESARCSWTCKPLYSLNACQSCFLSYVFINLFSLFFCITMASQVPFHVLEMYMLIDVLVVF